MRGETLLVSRAAANRQNRQQKVSTGYASLLERLLQTGPAVERSSLGWFGKRANEETSTERLRRQPGPCERSRTHDRGSRLARRAPQDHRGASRSLAQTGAKTDVTGLDAHRGAL